MKGVLTVGPWAVCSAVRSAPRMVDHLAESMAATRAQRWVELMVAERAAMKAVPTERSWVAPKAAPLVDSTVLQRAGTTAA